MRFLSAMKLKIKKPNWTRRTFIIVAFLVVAIAAFRAYLPSLVKDQTNRFLASELKDYVGHIEDLDLHIWRGDVGIEGFTLKKREGLKTYPFLAVEWTSVSIEWLELFRGSIVGEVHVLRPRVNFVVAKSKKEAQTEVPPDVQKIVQELIPIQINSFTVREGEVHLRDLNIEPELDVYANKISVTAENLRNTRDFNKELPSKISSTAKLLDAADMKLTVRLNALKKPVDFDLNSQVTNLPLKKMNKFFSAYGDFDVESGRADLFAEIAAQNGKIKGYVKPMMSNVEVVRWKKDKKKGLFNVLWQALVGTGVEAIENQMKDQNAAKIPIDGTFERPDVDAWEAVISVLRHAFVRALIPGTENSIGPNSP
jgi:hypothetical protein